MTTSERGPGDSWASARPLPGHSGRSRKAWRRRDVPKAIGSAGTLLVVAVAVLAVPVTGTPNKQASKPAGPLVKGEYDIPAKLVAKVEGVPVRMLVAAAHLAKPGDITPAEALPAKTKLLTSGGKPEILYIGAEFCPFCGGERWAMVMALSKFGTFTGLHGTSSSALDVDPSTPTFTFYKSSFTSKYLAFVPVETETNVDGTALQSPTNAEQALIIKWDVAPYTPEPYSIPFVYMAGKYVLTGTQYDASALSGMKFTKAISYITSTGNATSRGAEAAAGYLVGEICALTHRQPPSVCSEVPENLLGISVKVQKHR